MSPPLRAAEHLALFPGQLHSSSCGRAPTPVGDAEGVGDLQHTASGAGSKGGTPQAGREMAEGECAGCPEKQGTGRES